MPFENLKNFQGKRWFFFYLFAIINIFFFLLSIILIESYWNEMNYYVSYWLNFKINIALIIFLISCSYFLYVLYLFIKSYLLFKKGNELALHIINKVIPIIVLIIFDLLFIFILYFIGDFYWALIHQFDFYTITFYFLFLGSAAFLLNLFAKRRKIIKTLFTNRIMPAEKKSIIILIIITLYFIFSIVFPLIFIPANVILGKLPEKPEIIAHRGGAQLGPENTIEAVSAALDYGIAGWEIDIAISKDGVPFIMHDDTLKRTTNVEEVFPDRADDRADSFKWSELRKLDAGSWFVDMDPYGVISSGIISKSQAESYRGAKIPSLEEVLNFTREHNLILDFDFKYPPEDHPYHDVFIEKIFNLTIALIDNLHKIMIPTSSETWLNLIEKNNATDIWTYPEYINTADHHTNKEYLDFDDKNIPVMVYTIDSRERFSQLWCLGVDWVKTNAPQLYYDIKKPIWYMNYQDYILIWLFCYGCISIYLSLNYFISESSKKEKRKN
ncbi:MAG: glycerophosphodiester phosphodiesterase family protein [Promethearchaeota archaeon]